jgi:menaquinone-9 beta-reductase
VENSDAIVVGGGPAGSTCATWLARAGLDVLVLDRAVFPRDKACAGWITPQAIATLELDIRDYAYGRVLQPIRALRTCQLGAPAARVDYREVVGWGVRRCEFDHYLLRRSGARTRFEAVQSLKRTAGGFVVNERFRAPVLVGAGGQFCPVARSLGAQRGARALVVAQEIEARMSPRDEQRCPVRCDTPELYFCGDLQGYGWIFRKGPYLNVGFGRRDSRSFPARTQAFWKALRGRDRLPAGFAPPWPGHAYRLYQGAAPRLVDDGVVLVGDAAGLAYAQSGEGIGPAIESGRLAAAAIVSAGPVPSRGRLMAYERALRSRYGALPELLRVPLAGLTLAVPFLSRRLVLDPAFLHRDQAALTDPRPYLGPAPALGFA